MVRACTPKWRFGTQAWAPSGHGAFVGICEDVSGAVSGDDDVIGEPDGETGGEGRSQISLEPSVRDRLLFLSPGLA
jgi:hypothetical protein